MSDTLFELSCNQTITPTIGTYTGVDNNTPVYELVDFDYYLKNTSSHGYYYFNVTNTASRMLVSFDCVFNNKRNFNWIFLFENAQGQNWWGIGSYYSGLELRGTSTSAQTLKTNIVDGTKLHIDIQIDHSTLANVVTILIDNTEVLNINLPSTYELSNFELLGNTVSYTSNCYIKDLSIVTYGKDYLNKSGLAEVWANTKNYIAAQLLGKSDVGHTHSASEITDFPSGLTVDSTLDGTSSNAIANSAVKNALDGKSNTGHTHTKSEITDFPTLSTVATSGSYSDLSNKPTIPTALESLSTNSIPFHNSYPRCKYLGTSITDAQNTAIKNRTYDDLFIGDYWTINGVNWRIVAIDYYYNIGDTNFDKGNIIVMPDTVLYNAQMNTTDTTAGAYYGSLMRTQNLNNARTIAQNAFGSHLANHRIVLANTVDASGPSSWGWYDSDGVELPNEVQIYGTRVWGSALKGFDVATQKQQFPLMLFAPQFVNIRQNYWLQDVSSHTVSSLFALVSYNGIAFSNYASNSYGVRPSVTLSYI